VRLWSLHPKYLDARGLVALWREALLAQAVLRGETRGYRHHPQLARFADIGAIAEYLRGVHAESVVRGYMFAAGKISRTRCADTLVVRRGQLDYEWQHLMRKLSGRDPARARLLSGVRRPQAHPLFRVVAGSVEAWEKV
jgi:Pyrimidine dimer DNA glycosylase